MNWEQKIQSRKQMKNRMLEEPFDILVIGGGATGAGIALDASTRGLKAGLLEAGDFASGTSSRSSKLVHGGVRYLEQALLDMDISQYKLVREALQERSTFLKIAPHLSHPLPIITPVYSTFEKIYYRLGLKLYDWIAGKTDLPSSSFLSVEETLKRFPLLAPNGLKGSILYYDGQFNDARMNISVILTAIKEGATVLNYAEATSFIKEGGRIKGVEFRDKVKGSIHSVWAKAVINATGPFVDVLRRLEDPDAEPSLTISSGTHLLLDSNFSPTHTGLLIPKTDDGRVLFIMPWEGKTLAGTTDRLCELSLKPSATQEDMDYILRYIKRYCRKNVGRDDVRACWSGLRPLMKEEGKRSSQLSRSYTTYEGSAGLISIAGGKWTTYRAMAEHAVDIALKSANIENAGPSLTASTLLIGAEGYTIELAERLVKEYSLAHETARHLAFTYGTKSEQLIEEGGEEGLKQLAAGFPYIEAEVSYGVKEEMAITAIDIIARRLRLAFLDYNAALQALPQVITLMAPLLHWGKERQAQEHERTLEYLQTLKV